MWCTSGTWVGLGNPDPAAGAASSVRLAIDRSAQFSVAYRDGAAAVQVKKLVGPSWQNVGPAVAANGQSLALAFDESDNPCVAFADNSNGGRLTVARWTGVWTVAGGGPASRAGVDYVSMGIDGSGTIYVACEDLCAVRGLLRCLAGQRCLRHGPSRQHLAHRRRWRVLTR
jgi:hypothetical protein